MFCPQCGTQVPDDSAFCPNCGTRLSAPAPEPIQPEIPQPATYEQVPAQPDYQQQAFQPQAYEPSAYQQQTYQQQPAPQQPPFQAAPATVKGLSFTMPSSTGELFCSYNKAGAQYAESTGLQMKWYKALTVALLYLVAAGNLFAGLQNIIGISNGESSSYLYSMYPGMRVLDIVYGIVLLGIAFIALYVRMHLAQFKEDGPRLYLLMLLVNVCITAAFSLLTMVITGYYELSTVSGALLGGVIMYVLNRTYFGKRQHLFTM